MKVLITGIAGFAGSHLARLLVKEGYLVWGWHLPSEPLCRLKDIQDQIQLFPLDITNSKEVNEFIGNFKPDRIYHLAGLAQVGASWKRPRLTYEVNFFGLLNIVEALRESGIACGTCACQTRVLVVGSGEEYGRVEPDLQPISEETLLAPRSPYAVSKAAQEMLAMQYSKAEGFHLVLVRPFNHTGPGQDPNFVCSEFAKRIVQIEKKQIHPAQIQVGNLTARRDFLDVRDVVQAYHLALELCEPGVPYNISFGKAFSIEQLLFKLLEISSLKADLVKDESKIRPEDLPLLCGNCQKFRSKTKWFPKYKIDQTLSDLLEFWRQC